MIVGIIRQKPVLTYASIIFGGMLASVNLVRWATVATIDMGRKEGGCGAPFTELGPRLVQCGLRRGLLPYQLRHLHPSSHLATTDMSQKLGGDACAFFLGVAGSTLNKMSCGVTLSK